MSPSKRGHPLGDDSFGSLVGGKMNNSPASPNPPVEWITPEKFQARSVAIGDQGVCGFAREIILYACLLGSGVYKIGKRWSGLCPGGVLSACPATSELPRHRRVTQCHI